MRFEYEQALNRRYEAARLQYGTIPALEKEIAEAQANNRENRLLSEVVTENEIAEIVAKATNIPVAKLVQGDREKLLHLEDTLKKRVIGQDHAIELVSNAIIRQRAGIKDDKKPIGSFCSSVRPVSAKPKSAKVLRKLCLTAKTTSCAST